MWLSYETPWAMFLAVVVAETWRATAIVLVIIVAGVQLIPKVQRGGRDLRRQRLAAAHQGHAAEPQASIQTALILRTILALEVFAVVLALAGTNMPVLMGEAYAWQHEYQNAGVPPRPMPSSFS